MLMRRQDSPNQSASGSIDGKQVVEGRTQQFFGEKNPTEFATLQDPVRCELRSSGGVFILCEAEDRLRESSQLAANVTQTLIAAMVLRPHLAF